MLPKVYKHGCYLFDAQKKNKSVQKIEYKDNMEYNAFLNDFRKVV